MKKTIFISYAGCQSSNKLRDRIVPLLKKEYNIEEYAEKTSRDEDYDISNLIKSIGTSEIIIIILSEKFLTQSRYCIEEVREIMLRDRDDLKRRVFPIMDSDFQDMLGDAGLGNEQECHRLQNDSIKFIKTYISEHLSLATESRKRRFDMCLDTQKDFIITIFDKSNWVAKFTDCATLVEKIKAGKIKTRKIKKSFNERDCDTLLSFKYPRRELLDKCRGKDTYRYRVWKCDDFNGIYIMGFFQSTSAPFKAIAHFITNIEELPTKPVSLTILKLRDTSISSKVTSLLTAKSIKYRTMTYNEYFWSEYVRDKFDKLDMNINEINEYYIEQKFYTYAREPHKLDTAIENINKFLLNEGTEPIMLILADAGMGKTQLVKQVMNHIDKKLKDRHYIFIDSRKLRKGRVNISDEINSIYDLYTIYFRVIGDSHPLNFSEFYVGLANGTVVILIDGWDEVRTLFSQKLNEDMFFTSLHELNLKLGECKVIITSRYIGWGESRLLSGDTVNVYTLQGFDEELLNIYLDNRYEKYKDIEDKEKKIRIEKVKKYINQIKETLQENERNVPFIIDLLCKIIDDERKDIEGKEINLSTYIPYPNNNNALDRVLYADLEREYLVQSYKNLENICVVDLVKILMIFAIEIGDSGDESDMEIIISLVVAPVNSETLDSLISEKLKLLRYFDNLRNGFRFTYEFFKNYLVSLFFINLFTNDKNSLVQIDKEGTIRVKEVLSKFKDPDNDPVFRDIVKYFGNSHEKQLLFKKNVKLLLKEIINVLKKEISEMNGNDVSVGNRANKKIWHSQYAINTLLYLLMFINGKGLDANARTGLIKEVYEVDDSIEYLSINNNFPPLDFSNLKIKNSIFDNYSNFEKCKFNKSVFETTEFLNMTSVSYPYNKDQLTIDSSCTLNGMGDIEHLTNEQYGEILQLLLQKFIKNNKKFQDFIVAKTSNSYFISQIECLVTNDIVSKEEKKDNYVFRMTNQADIRRNIKAFIDTPIISASAVTQSTVECLKLLDLKVAQKG